MKKLSALVIVLLVCGVGFGAYRLYSRTRPVPPPAPPAAHALSPAAGDPVASVQPDTGATPNALPPVMLAATAPGGQDSATGKREVVPVETRRYLPRELSLSPTLDKQSRAAACGLLIDPMTRQILWQKNADIVHPIASMTKMMTVLLALEAIERDPNLTLQSRTTVSKLAAEEGGSELWLEAGATYPLEPLMEAMMIKSANDAAWVVGEAIGGDMDTFVAMMNRRARQLNMRYARFYNPNGLPIRGEPEKDNRATAFDIANLALSLETFPEVFGWSSTARKRFVHENGTPIDMDNTNRLVREGVPGVIGLKTGYVDSSGFCVTVVCERENRQLIAVVMGFDARQDRDTFMKGLLDWGYTQLAPLP